MAETITYEPINLVPPKVPQLLTPAETALKIAEEMVISTQMDATIANDDMRFAKKRAAALEEERKGFTRPLDEAKEKVMGWFRKPVETWKGVVDVYERKLLAYQRQIDADRRAEEQRLRDEYHLAQAQAQATAAAEAAKAKSDAAALQKQADDARQSGDDAKAAELDVRAQTTVEVAQERRAAVVVVPPPVVMANAPKLAGTHKATTHKARVIDFGKMAAFCADPKNAMFLPLLTFDQSKLNAQARASGASLAIPGVEVYEDESLRTRK